MMVKSKSEIESLHRGGRILSEILAAVVSDVSAGVTGLDLSMRAGELIQKAGGKPAFVGYGTPPFPAPLCVSTNACVVHGIPNKEQFKVGDIIGLDIGMVYEGLYTDMARTVAVKPIMAREQLLIDVAYNALDLAVSLVRPGITTGDIGHAVQKYVEKQGFGVVRDLAGHGVGYALHEAPEIPNFGKKKTGAVLESGMVIALEPMITMGDWQVEIAHDGWSVVTKDRTKSAHVEDTIVVTETGCKGITR
jgi:methionyl aminopeptidase